MITTFGQGPGGRLADSAGRPDDNDYSGTTHAGTSLFAPARFKSRSAACSLLVTMLKRSASQAHSQRDRRPGALSDPSPSVTGGHQSVQFVKNR
jgi:hypothetical protein